MKPSKLAAKWEAKLRAEGLAHLDHDDGCDIIVGNKGSGKLHPDASADGQLDNRRAAEAVIDRRRVGGRCPCCGFETIHKRECLLDALLRAERARKAQEAAEAKMNEGAPAREDMPSS